ncbi:MAG: endonuclease/exonuclease/phosphatase family protein [Pseudomonadota bacterium]
MQIMCLNAWGGTLHAALLPYLAASPADVICLQEIVHTPATSKPWLTYKDGDHVLPQRANLFAEVAQALPDHTAIFCPAARGSLWDAETELPSFWGLATFVRSSLPIVAQHQSFVHKTYSPDGYGEHPRSRSAHAIRMYDHRRDRAIGIAHIHGLRDLNGKGDTPERLTQAHKLLGIAGSVFEPEDVQVICGDFNVLPESETLEVFAQAGFTELVTTNGHPGTRTSHYQKPGRFADYVFVNPVSAIKSFAVVRTPEASDHCPLVVEL